MVTRKVTLMRRILGLMVAACIALPAAAQSKESELKAAFVYNFAKFTEWPDFENNSANLNLCLVGNGTLGKVLSNLKGRNVRGHELNVIKVDSTTQPGDCHILYVSRSEAGNADALMNSLAGKHGLLSVSDIDGFTKSGGIIELKVVNNKMRFSINLRAAREADLTLSSKLLRLATSVEE